MLSVEEKSEQAALLDIFEQAAEEEVRARLQKVWGAVAGKFESQPELFYVNYVPGIPSLIINARNAEKKEYEETITLQMGEDSCLQIGLSQNGPPVQSDTRECGEKVAVKELGRFYARHRSR